MARFSRLPWTLILVLSIAAALRAFDLTQWSLWEDEETTVYFSQNLGKPFPRLIPLFFTMLHGLYRLTGVSVAAGRCLVAVLGVLSIALSYACLNRFLSRTAALGASWLLTVCLGHVFWSQSIRYYILVYLFQVLSVYWFLLGFEEKNYLAPVGSIVAFFLALLSHYSALLLAPVYVAYLALTLVRREAAGAYGIRGYLVFGISFLLMLALFAERVSQMQGMLSGWAIPSARDPIHILKTVLAYFGAPFLVLGILGAFIARQTCGRRLAFFILLGALPVLALIVIAGLDLINVTWYYGFIALFGFAPLAALALEHLYQNGRPRLALTCFGGATLYYGIFLVAYYTIMQGDRPRWAEAARYVQETANVRVGEEGNPTLYAGVTEVVLFYMGVEPSVTMQDTLVKLVPPVQPESTHCSESWFIVEVRLITADYADWFAKHGTLKARFDAHTGAVDRSLLVYHCRSE